MYNTFTPPFHLKHYTNDYTISTIKVSYYNEIYETMVFDSNYKEVDCIRTNDYVQAVQNHYDLYNYYK